MILEFGCPCFNVPYTKSRIPDVDDDNDDEHDVRSLDDSFAFKSTFSTWADDDDEGEEGSIEGTPVVPDDDDESNDDVDVIFSPE